MGGYSPPAPQSPCFLRQWNVYYKHSLILTYHSETCSCSHAFHSTNLPGTGSLQSCPTHMLTLHNFLACELLTSLQQACLISTCELACLSITMSRLQLLLFLSAFSLALSLTPLSVPFRGHKAFYRRSGAGDDPGNPVYLTPYIKAGQIDQGR